MAVRADRKLVDEDLLKTIRQMNERGQRRVVETRSSESTVVPDFVGHTLAIHDGSEFVRVRITDGMIGQKLGEIAFKQSRLLRLSRMVRKGRRRTTDVEEATPVKKARLHRPIRRGETVTITSTEAQNGFGRVLDAVAKEGTVLITKRNVTQAVVISAERYEALTRAQAPQLDELTAEFDTMLAGMQGSASREAMRAAYASSPDELGQAAFAAAHRNP